METNNPPNPSGFVKKPTERNKSRFPKRKPHKKTVDFNLMSKDEIKAFKYIHACFFLTVVATVLKDVFDDPNAE